MTYEIWPGARLSETPVEWNKILGSAATSTKCTANVERRRNEGSDFSTLRGISKKGDALIRTPQRMRQRPPGVLGPVPGVFLRPEGRAGKIRAALADGPMTRAELCAALDIDPKNISGHLKNDIQHGRIVVIQKEGNFQQFALAGSV